MGASGSETINGCFWLFSFRTSGIKNLCFALCCIVLSANCAKSWLSSGNWRLNSSMKRWNVYNYIYTYIYRIIQYKRIRPATRNLSDEGPLIPMFDIFQIWCDRLRRGPSLGRCWTPREAFPMEMVHSFHSFSVENRVYSQTNSHKK